MVPGLSLFKKVRAAVLIGEARRLASLHQPGRALDKLLAAYAILGEVAPSARLPLEVNLSLAAMSANTDRYELALIAITLAQEQMPRDPALKAPDRVYLGAYIKALGLLCAGESWRDALTDRGVAAAAQTSGVRRHLRLNFPLT